MKPQLLQRRTTLTTQMRQLLDSAEGDLNAEQSQQFDAWKTELTQLDTRIANETWLDEQERRAVGHSLGDNQFDTQVDQFSLRRAIAGQAGLDVDSGLEREVSRELARRTNVAARGILVPLRCFQRRVVTTGLPVGGPGGNLIATELHPEEYIDLLRAKLITARLGARTLSGLVGDVDLPAATVSAGAAWVAENSALSSTDAE